MFSKRILAIACYIDPSDNLIDVGCDHGYLGIYLRMNNLVNDLLLTDLRSSALNNAIENINKYNLSIDTFLTDGIKNIKLKKYNTISISGMGTQTIIKILSELKKKNNINKIIIQSNNDLDILRSYMNSLGYYLDDEITVYENDIYYVVCKFIKSDNKNTNEEIRFGLVKEDKIDYYNYLVEYYSGILKKIPKYNVDLINELKSNISLLKKLLKECR